MLPQVLSSKLTRGILFFSLICFGGCSGPAGDPANGKRWYMMHNCSSCHGPNGNDGRAVNIAGIQMSFGSFLRKLRTADTPIMPVFPESKISRQDAADIYSYLKSISAKDNSIM
jgi:mono/diheme cytochrome c family protein